MRRCVSINPRQAAIARSKRQSVVSTVVTAQRKEDAIWRPLFAAATGEIGLETLDVFSAATRGASRGNREVEKIPAEGRSGARLLRVVPEESAEFFSCP